MSSIIIQSNRERGTYYVRSLESLRVRYSRSCADTQSNVVQYAV